MKKPVARIVFENFRDEFVITSDACVQVLVVDHTWPDCDEPHRVLHRPTIRPNEVEQQFKSTKRRNRDR
jgi:hypothetical protein